MATLKDIGEFGKRFVHSENSRPLPEVAPERTVTTYVMTSGIIAGLALSLLMSIARFLTLMNFSLEFSLGSLLLGSTAGTARAVTWIIGFVLHLAASAVFALFYAAGFRWIDRADYKVGMAFGVVHWFFVGLFYGILPGLRPNTFATIFTPGIFGVQTGMFGFLFIFALHLLFGAIVGAAYHRLAHDHPEVLELKRY